MLALGLLLAVTISTTEAGDEVVFVLSPAIGLPDATWEDAQTACQSKGWHLARILSVWDQERIKFQLLGYQAGIAQGFYASSGHGGGMWVGANDRDEEGQWRWTNGELLSSYGFAGFDDSTGQHRGVFPWGNQSSLAADEPDGGSAEDCALVDLQHSVGLWKDHPCDSLNPFVCEQPLGNISRRGGHAPSPPQPSMPPPSPSPSPSLPPLLPPHAPDESASSGVDTAALIMLLVPVLLAATCAASYRPANEYLARRQQRREAAAQVALQQKIQQEAASARWDQLRNQSGKIGLSGILSLAGMKANGAGSSHLGRSGRNLLEASTRPEGSTRSEGSGRCHAGSISSDTSGRPKEEGGAADVVDDADFQAWLEMREQTAKRNQQIAAAASATAAEAASHSLAAAAATKAADKRKTSFQSASQSQSKRQSALLSGAVEVVQRAVRSKLGAVREFKRPRIARLSRPSRTSRVSALRPPASTTLFGEHADAPSVACSVPLATCSAPRPLASAGGHACTFAPESHVSPEPSAAANSMEATATEPLEHPSTVLAEIPTEEPPASRPPSSATDQPGCHQQEGTGAPLAAPSPPQCLPPAPANGTTPSAPITLAQRRANLAQERAANMAKDSAEI